MALALCACSDEGRPGGADGGQGYLSLSLTASPEVAVSAPTRAEIPTLTAPDVESFAVRLTKSDNTYSKTWNSLGDFNAEDMFDTGTYTLEAFSGDMDTEGFDAPYFYGAAQISVLEAKKTQASITASLANSMVSVDYTDAFKAYFSEWSAKVHSAGHSFIDFARDETRAAFIVPGEVDLTISFTTPQGQSASIQPDGFTARPRHHYRVVFDVAQGSGDASLKIIFSDELVAEDVEIDLSDELFTTPAPEVKPEGFTSGVPVEGLEGSEMAKYAFNVVARGGMKEAKLTVDSDWRPPFGNEVDLLATTADVRSQITGSGIVEAGFFKNPGRLGRLDLSGFVKQLPAGEHRMSLVVKDRFLRVSEPVTLVVTSEPMTVKASAEAVAFGSPTAVVAVDYNGLEAEKAFSFKALDKFGVYRDCEVVSVAEASTRAFAEKRYFFTVTLPDTERDRIPVQVYFYGTKKADVEIPVLAPSYSVQADAFASKVVLKVSHPDPKVQQAIFNALKVSVSASGSARGGSYSFTRDADSGLITVTGFSPATSYTVHTKVSPDASAQPLTSTQVTTEAAAAVPNGDFSQTSQTVNIGKIQTGGKFLVGAITYTVFSSISAYEPASWASVNARTAYTGASNQNTWYVVPSTMAADGAVKLRSVAYDHAGADIARTGSFFSTTYYNPTAANPSQRAAGELFLGSYSYAGSESRTDGVAFTSRPSSMTFDYQYAPLGSEKGEAYIALRDASGSVIATATCDIPAASSMTRTTVNLPAYPFGKKAATIEIRFRSTKGNSIAVNIPSGSKLNEGGGLKVDYTVGTNAYKALATGSELTLDNVKLNY